ncbi:Acyl-coenzyme A thioesterase PaaI [compost metagenome]
MAPGEADLQMTISEIMIQGHASCHGGYLFTLADSAFAYACNSYDDATVALGASIDFIAPGRLGDVLTARATQVSRSGRTGNYDVRIENQHGQLIAVFHGKSYKIRGTVRQQENQA